jgi:hypothetical protein
MHNFDIDPQFIESITVVNEYSTYDDTDNITEEDLINTIKGTNSIRLTGSADHPEFARLREYLGENGFIKIERGWWNGDTVTKAFTLNNAMFNVGDNFPSASAMKTHLKYAKYK